MRATPSEHKGSGISHVPCCGRSTGVEIAEIAQGDRCCGAAGLYNLTEPDMARTLMRQKAEAIGETHADVVASANPGCTMQLRAGLAAIGSAIDVVHPVQLLDRAYRREAGT